MDFDLETEIERCIPSSFPKESVKTALNYKPTENDLFIVSYPKCGTTWTQQIVYLLLNSGQPPDKTILFSKSIPFLEFCEPKPRLPEETELRVFKTHLPFHLIPFNSNSKYIYCVRNPKDCCVSFWYHERDFPLLNCQDFNQFFQLFINGKTGYGHYFDHLLGWLQEKHRNNILVVQFEDLKNKFESELKRIANFISNDLLSRLNSDHKFRENVIKFSSFEFMRNTTNKQMESFFNMSAEELRSDEQIVNKFKEAFSHIKETAEVRIAPEVNFVRKGIIGDFKTHLTDEQNILLNDKIKDKLQSFPELYNKWISI